MIDQSRNILVVSHKNPDGDTLGSACSLIQYCQLKNKTVNGFCVDQIPDNLSFLLPKINFLHDKEALNIGKHDLVISVDCGELKQTGIHEILSNRPAKTFFINIDHHFTNDNYGDLNLVHSKASSTSEIVYNIFNSQNIKITKGITNCLLTGILTDTTYFSNAATTIDSIRAASSLLTQGAKIKEITQNIWKNKNVTSLKLWGRIFDRLIHDNERGIVTAIITREDVTMDDLPDDALEGMSNFLTSLYEAKVIIVLTQMKENIIKGSLRTTHHDIDVSALAKTLGGGGHRKAAGFTVQGNLVEKKEGWVVL